MGRNVEFWRLLLLTVFILFLFYYLRRFKVFDAIKGSSMTALLSIVMCYWTFYIHRNSFNYEINLIKRSILFGFLLYCICCYDKVSGKEQTRADFHE